MDESRAAVERVLEDMLSDEHVRQMEQFNQHNGVTTFQHCFNVAVMSMFLCRVLGWKVSVRSMLLGAILHDFYLYDWHDGRRTEYGIHGFVHPRIALANAREFFELTEKEANIIASHMFPLTITKVPKSREALVVSVADKICAVREYVQSKH